MTVESFIAPLTLIDFPQQEKFDCFSGREIALHPAIAVGGDFEAVPISLQLDHLPSEGLPLSPRTDKIWMRAPALIA